MSKYVDLVLVKFDEDRAIRLYEAPFDSFLGAGETVKCELGTEDILGKVVLRKTVERDGSEYNLIKSLIGLDSVKRIKAKVTFREYVEEEEDEQG